MRLFIRLLNLNERGIETVSMLLGTVLTLIGAILLMGSSVITGMIVIALGVFFVFRWHRQRQANKKRGDSRSNSPRL